MKKIGLIGGIGWESSLEYYRIINQKVNKELGGIHSAEIILISLDLDTIAKHQEAGEWDKVGDILAVAAKNLQTAEADIVLLCSNTVHRVADRITSVTKLPFVNLVDIVGQQIQKQGLKKVGLLGTRFTMEDGFYQEKLRGLGIETITPDGSQRKALHDIIFHPDFLGEKRFEASQLVRDLIDDLASQGAEGIILGCTELMFVAASNTSKVPLFDTTQIHASEAVRQALI